TVTDTGLSLTGSGAGNYQLSSTTATAKANITPAALTLTALTNTKVNDGTTTAAAIPTASGLQGTDSLTNLTESYASPYVGTGKTLNVATYTINDGNSGGNYAVTLVANNSGAITSSSAIAIFNNGKDATTEGSWINVYGSQGYNVINATNGVNYP